MATDDLHGAAEVPQSAELSTSLDTIRKQLNQEIGLRKRVTKPLEDALRALKDPHKFAVALSESVAALEKPPQDVNLPENYSELVAQVRVIADEKLSELEFTFARDLRTAFQEKGITLDGPPNALVADLFLIKPDMRKKRVDITFSRQPVTSKTIKLNVDAVVSAYDRARKEIFERKTDYPQLLADLFAAYERLLKLNGEQVGARTGIVDLYTELIWVRQPAAFRKTPSNLTFLDYPKTHFIYDMLQLRQHNILNHNEFRLNFGVSTIEVGSDSRKAMFLATGANEGAFIKDLYFTVEKSK
ncbi:MAG: hypothetical protein HY774_00735 [Acidobacteria bacterium]|nr:hypothetical protein [Acidobacteriota bacterium]